MWIIISTPKQAFLLYGANCPPMSCSVSLHFSDKIAIFACILFSLFLSQVYQRLIWMGFLLCVAFWMYLYWFLMCVNGKQYKSFQNGTQFRNVCLNGRRKHRFNLNFKKYLKISFYSQIIDVSFKVA